jgi:hypothetical protein
MRILDQFCCVGQHFSCDIRAGAAREQFSVHAKIASREGGCTSVSELSEAEAAAGGKPVGQA